MVYDRIPNFIRAILGEEGFNYFEKAHEEIFGTNESGGSLGADNMGVSTVEEGTVLSFDSNGRVTSGKVSPGELSGETATDGSLRIQDGDFSVSSDELTGLAHSGSAGDHVSIDSDGNLSVGQAYSLGDVSSTFTLATGSALTQTVSPTLPYSTVVLDDQESTTKDARMKVDGSGVPEGQLSYLVGHLGNQNRVFTHEYDLQGSLINGEFGRRFQGAIILGGAGATWHIVSWAAGDRSSSVFS